MVSFACDANGARTNKIEIVDGTTNVVASYPYDEDNRLTAVALNSATDTHQFKYDYKSRRYYRNTPSASEPHMYCVFDGGLSVQEYSSVSQASSLPSSTHLPKTEFIRTEMGGNVRNGVDHERHEAHERGFGRKRAQGTQRRNLDDC